MRKLRSLRKIPLGFRGKSPKGSRKFLRQFYKRFTRLLQKFSGDSLGKAPPKFSGEITEHYKKNEKTKKQIISKSNFRFLKRSISCPNYQFSGSSESKRNRENNRT